MIRNKNESKWIAVAACAAALLAVATTGPTAWAEDLPPELALSESGQDTGSPIPPAESGPSSEKLSKKDKKKIENSAYDDARATIIPLEPEEIIKFRHDAEAVEKARNRPLVVPKPGVRTITLDLAPGSTPGHIYLRPEFDTSVTVIDVAGKPWTIERFWVGDNGAYTAQAGGKATVVVKAKKPNRVSNLTIYLKGMDEPITMTLVYGEVTVDYKATLIVPEIGPGTIERAEIEAAKKASILKNLPKFADADLSKFIDGVKPKGATVIPVFGDQKTSAWAFRGKLVVRTDKIMVSPAHSHIMRGGSGYRVYVVTNVTPVLVLLQDGTTKLANMDLSTANIAKAEKSYGR